MNRISTVISYLTRFPEMELIQLADLISKESDHNVDASFVLAVKTLLWPAANPASGLALSNSDGVHEDALSLEEAEAQGREDGRASAHFG